MVRDNTRRNRHNEVRFLHAPPHVAPGSQPGASSLTGRLTGMLRSIASAASCRSESVTFWYRRSIRTSWWPSTSRMTADGTPWASRSVAAECRGCGRSPGGSRPVRTGGAPVDAGWTATAAYPSRMARRDHGRSTRGPRAARSPAASGGERAGRRTRGGRSMSVVTGGSWGRPRPRRARWSA
jgi:hypothetical protein